MTLVFNLCQSIWVSARGSEKELDEAKLRFAAAEVLYLSLFLDKYQTQKQFPDKHGGPQKNRILNFRWQHLMFKIL